MPRAALLRGRQPQHSAAIRAFGQQRYLGFGRGFDPGLQLTLRAVVVLGILGKFRRIGNGPGDIHAEDAATKAAGLLKFTGCER